jgi:hypothetical protein
MMNVIMDAMHRERNAKPSSCPGRAALVVVAVVVFVNDVGVDDGAEVDENVNDVTLDVEELVGD